MLSSNRPLPSMEIRTPACLRALVQAQDVNWLPWSVFMISGAPCRAIAYVSASTQGSASRVFDRRHVKTLRVAQSMMMVR